MDPSSTNANARAIIASMNRPLLPSAPPRSLSRQRPNPRSNLAQTGTFSVHSWPKSVPYPSQMSHGPDTKGSRMDTLKHSSGEDPLNHCRTAAPEALSAAHAKGAVHPDRLSLPARRLMSGVPSTAGSASPTYLKTPDATRPCALVSRLYRMQPPNLEGLSGRSWDRGAAW